MTDTLQVLMAVLIVILAGICTWLDWKLDEAKQRFIDSERIKDSWKQNCDIQSQRLTDALRRADNAISLLCSRTSKMRGRPSRAKDLKAMQDALDVLNGKG